MTQTNIEMYCKYSQHKHRMRCKKRKALQILTTQTNKKTCCNYSQHKQIQKCAANNQTQTNK